jgi:hypothetical protein
VEDDTCGLICGCYGAGDEDDNEDTRTQRADWEVEDQ